MCNCDHLNVARNADIVPDWSASLRKCVDFLPVDSLLLSSKKGGVPCHGRKHAGFALVAVNDSCLGSSDHSYLTQQHSFLFATFLELLNCLNDCINP